MFAQPSAAVLNHLLMQNDGAPTRLARFAGKTVRFDIAPFSFVYTILPDGMLRSAETDATADAVCVIAPSLLPRLALHDERAQADVGTEGDAALLTEIFSLSRTLRWDAARDLSRITGDVLAERIVHTAQDVRQQLHETANKLSKAATEYCTGKQLLLARPQEVAEFIRQVDTLRDDVARLEQRIRQLPVARDH